MKNKNNLLKAYEIDASQITGKALDVIFPKNVAELKQAVRESSRVTIRGGGTGLAGGAVPQHDVVIDMSKLDRIGELDKERKTVEKNKAKGKINFLLRKTFFRKSCIKNIKTNPFE